MERDTGSLKGPRFSKYLIQGVIYFQRKNWLDISLCFAWVIRYIGNPEIYFPHGMFLLERVIEEIDAPVFDENTPNGKGREL